MYDFKSAIFSIMTCRKIESALRIYWGAVVISQFLSVSLT